MKPVLRFALVILSVAALAAPALAQRPLKADRIPASRGSAAKMAVAKTPAPHQCDRAPTGTSSSASTVRRRRTATTDTISAAPQLRSATCSSFLLSIQERPRNATSITKPRPEDASFMSFSETWPKA